MSPLLTLPRPDSSRRYALRRTELRNWLDALPLNLLPAGNAPEAARCVIQRLAAMNRARMGARTRLALAEMCRNKAEVILPALEAELSHAALPLSGRLRATAAVTDELLVELGYAYKTALVALAESLFPAAVRRLFQVAVLQAMRALARRLSVSYRIYAPAPKTVWREMHLLFQLAAKHQTAEVAGADDFDSPSSVYRGALLLAFAEPHKLLQGDVDRILAYLASFCGRSALVLGTAAADGPGLFLVRPERDGPGHAYTKLRPAGASKTTDAGGLALDCLPLVELLLDQIDRLRAGVSHRELGLPESAAEPMFRDLMARLARQWGNVTTRQFGRLHAHARVEILVGLRPIWKFLTGAGDRGLSSKESNEWMVANESPGGFALMHISGRFEPIRVGEVVAVRTADACHICVVRWILSNSPEHVELGLQQLAPGATPIEFGREQAEGSEPALLLPEMPALRRPASILARYGRVDASKDFFMGAAQSQLRIRATRLIEQTRLVQMFHFSAAGSPSG